MKNAVKRVAYTLAKEPARVPVPGNKTIEEFIGQLNSETNEVSVAYMIAPPGWKEPEQTPEFDEITIVVSGCMQVEAAGDKIILEANQTILIHRNQTVRYSNPFEESVEYWAICIPAFTNETVNRETE